MLNWGWESLPTLDSSLPLPVLGSPGHHATRFLGLVSGQAGVFTPWAPGRLLSLH